MGDMYIAFRRNNLDDLAWDEVRPLPELNSASNEFGPSAYENPDGSLTFFYNSDRPGGLGGLDILTSTLGSSGTFTAPKVVAELSSPSPDEWPVVRLDGLEIFLASSRPGTNGGNDLWSSTRGSTSDSWSTPVNLGAVVNTSNNEGRSWVYAGGTRLLFFSNRPGGNGANDLYETRRTPSVIIPVVGATTGVGGATFKTIAQLSNPTATGISGSFVFRPAGTQPSAADPRVLYTLAPFESRTLDLMSTFGVTGIGSLEIQPGVGTAPSSVVRIENGGTIFVPQVRAEDTLVRGSRGVLFTPSDASRSRLNVGVRTFSSGARLTIALYDAAGKVVRTISRSYPANMFTQVAASDFVEGPAGANQSIVITVDSGSAVVYGSTVVSGGQGSTLQIASRVQ